ncbi:MAG: hypothetical protein LJE70_07625 [Chromatiaceae bacterium]|nr:hypothetical protein [Chromatiaceae bacterium]
MVCLIGTQLEPSVCEEQIREDTEYLDLWFNAALTEFEDVGRYPWNELPLPGPVYGLSTGDEEYNPFIGFYRLENSEENATGEKVPFNTKYKFKSPRYVLPKQCTQEDYRLARQGDVSYIRRLSDCAVNFEIHTSGFHAIWKYLYDPFADKDQPLSDDAILDITRAIRGLDANQYGRTMFLFAGVPEQHVAVSFDLLDEIRDSEDDDKVLVDAMSIYDKVYGGSIYIQYLPMVNPADRTLHWKNENDPGKNYKDDFWHAFLMSNHMNQDPDHFIRGIRGRTLWHNEYRSNKLYQSEELGHNDHTEFENILGHIDFPAGFQTDRAGLAPFHGNTCDSCHVRNGSGIPLMPNGKLPQIHVNGGMKADYHVKTSDYTYTNRTFANQEVPSMKMVFFDLVGPSETNRNECDDDNHTVPNEIDLVPIRPARRADELYSNKIMNFYGNSLQLNQNGGKLLYDMKYVDISDGDGFEIVDKTLRGPIVGDNENATYQPKRVEIDASGITESEVCSAVRARPPGVAGESWPSDCEEVSGDAINKAIADGEIGFMHLLGRRLGNTPLIEMIPDKMIRQTRREQLENSVPGCISLAPGTRSGKDGEYNYRSCSSGRFGDGRDDCYIGRWGWIGDRASLEDQIANAAHVEMNISSKEGYQDLHPLPDSEDELVRYGGTLCGPANAGCRPLSAANSDITEQEIRDMATYQRWIGIPNRSEYQVASEKVQQGERIFNELQCSSCHVTKKIAFRYDDNMLPDEERDHLRRLEIPAGSEKPAEDSEPDLDYPFVSYLGTDLLMHDMGYLSQIARAPMDKELRWDNGRVKPEYRNYVQYIRTPALKGLRFNRFVTDSNHNTKDAKEEVLENNFAPGCDFLLHDGRACDAIEAAYLHDGPAVNRLKMIEKMNALSADELDQLRAFLYSL